MISSLRDGGLGAFHAVCALHPAFGAQLCTDWRVYGESSDHCRFWAVTGEDGAPQGALSLRFGRLTMLAEPDADRDELLLFLRGLDGVDEAFGPQELFRRMDLGDPVGSAPILTYQGLPPDAEPDPLMAAIESDPPLSEVSKLLRMAAPDFLPGRGRLYDAWYAYTSHILRHGLGFSAGIWAKRALIATAGVYATGSGVGLIANVATHPKHRRQGLAAALVRYLTGRLLRRGQVPALFAADEHLGRYYQGLGFAVADTWEKRILRGNSH